MKALVTRTDEPFDDLYIDTGYYQIEAKCADCSWSESRNTLEEEEIDQRFVMGLRHSRATGHRVGIRRWQEWEVAPMNLDL